MSEPGGAAFHHGHPYRGAVAAVATQHLKTAILDRALGGPRGLVLRTVTIDTDAFGTFTGDVARTAGPAETALAKARRGVEVAGLDLGLASEGSFGPHPVVGLVTYQQEVVVLHDALAGLTVTGRAAGPAPWAVSRRVTPDDPLPADLDPTVHALVARPHEPVPVHSDEGITKGIGNVSALHWAIRRAAAWSRTGTVVVESDLRAHVCPRRHPLLLAAAADLAARLAHRCPACGSPGFGHVEAVRGAPCAWCGHPTELPRETVDGCPACEHVVRRPVPGDGRADPGSCPRCNP